jgi:hypothetical protein
MHRCCHRRRPVGHQDINGVRAAHRCADGRSDLVAATPASLPLFAELSGARSCGATKKIPARDDKSQNPVDADSTLTHVGESSVHVTSFAFRGILLQFPGDARCTTASISLRLRLSS